ncbi:SLATT domain-containing protein [Streptomyces uncialis]|uniref:SLATT domain-containing protein n=1 Tax=Streptomyces uncialis TaxID=1048205 RepID=UPI00386E913A|nr:SLATT domain-containing protein [Streptomyces uncialis]
MSQPEMQPEGQPEGTSPEGRGEGGGARPGDLSGRRLPLGDWGEPADRLDELYRWVELGALDTVRWYLADRVWKRRCARALRGGAAVLGVAGAALPVADPAGAGGGVARWGYLALLLAVACVGCDRFFGLTSGWMRDVATAQAVQRRLQVLQFDWASECVREVLGPAEGTASEAVDRCLSVLRRFSDDVLEMVRVETTDWMAEFRAGPVPLGLQAGVAGVLLGRGETGGGGRSAVPQVGGAGPTGGARPNMPRQRPPEPR